MPPGVLSARYSMEVESWLTDERIASLTAYANALGKGAEPSEGLAAICPGAIGCSFQSAGVAASAVKVSHSRGLTLSRWWP